MTPYVPKPLTSGAKAEGRFGKQDFVYVAEDNTYRCPAGESLTWRFSSVEHGMVLHSYWTTRCESCTLKMNARPVSSAASSAGSMKLSWTPCSIGWIRHRTSCGSEGRPSNTPSTR